LTFWQRVNTFKALCGRPNLTQNDYQIIIDDAKDILINFINDGSPLEINISFEMRARVQTALTKQLAALQSSRFTVTVAIGTSISPPPSMGASSSSSLPINPPIGLASRTTSPSIPTGSSGGSARHVMVNTQTTGMAALRYSTPNTATSSVGDVAAHDERYSAISTFSKIFDESQVITQKGTYFSTKQCDAQTTAN
jgi:hypothetical protein